VGIAVGMQMKSGRRSEGVMGTRSIPKHKHGVSASATNRPRKSAVFASQKITSLWRDTDGSALVEATVLTPILIVLFFGVFEFSWYFSNQQLAEIGVRDAARYLARNPYFSGASPVEEGTDPCQDAANVAAAKNLAVTGTIDGSGGARVRSWTTADVHITCQQYSNPLPSPPFAGPNPYLWRVTVWTQFVDPQLGYLGLLGLGTPNIYASHMERSFGTG
jgi:hypothetical protein